MRERYAQTPITDYTLLANAPRRGKPPVYPDLVVTQITYQGDFVTGNTIQFRATVTNQGNGPAGVSTTRFQFINGNVLTDIPTQELNPGKSRSLITQPWVATVGTHTLRVTADVNHEVAESDGTNNTRDFVFEVIDPVILTPEPDLLVTDLVVVGNLIEQEQLTFRVTVANQGDGDAAASTLSLVLDGDLFVDIVTPALANGESIQLISSVWNATSGDHTLVADADVADVLVESNEENNTRSIEFLVAELPPPPPPPPVLVYPKGIWSFYGQHDDIDAGMIANKGVVGLIIGEDWNVVNPSEGVFVWTTIDAKVAKAKANGFKIVINIINSSLATPAWVIAKPGIETIPLMDPSSGHPDTFCRVADTALFWDPIFHQARKDLAAAAGDHFTTDTSIIGVTIGFANYHSNDFNFTDYVGDIQCPACPGNPPQLCGIQHLNQPQQWLDANFTMEKMAIVGEELLDVYAAHWPNQFLKVPIGGLAPQLLANYSELARAFEDRIFGLNGFTVKSYANRVSLQRNTLNARWADGTTYDSFTPDFNSDTYIRYMIRKHITGFFNLAGLQSVDTATGGFPDCRQGGGGGGPCGPTCNALCVITNSIRVEETFGVEYYEIFVTDGRNPSFDAVLKTATLAMGGTLRV